MSRKGNAETTVRDGVVWTRLDGVLLFQTALAANRGFQARSFSDESQALTWVNAGRH